VLERVEQRQWAEVESVVVRQGHAVDAEPDEGIDRCRWRTEEERLAWIEPARSALGDAALEIEHEQIRRASDRDDLVRDELLRATEGDRLGHRASQHGVTGKSKRHSHRRIHRLSTSRPWLIQVLPAVHPTETGCARYGWTMCEPPPGPRSTP
jgi:hypothetical protein